MNFVIGKFGKSVKFNSSTWGPHGGDIDAPTLYKKLAELYPGHNFYMIGKSDVKRYKESLPTNIIDVWSEYDKNKDNHMTYVYYKLKDVDIDFGIMMSGPVSNINTPNKYPQSKDKNSFAKTLFCFENYVAPMYHYLNETKLKYINISPDPRYHRPGFDCGIPPMLDLGQKDAVIKQKTFSNHNNPSRSQMCINDINSRYIGIETMGLIDRELHEEWYTNNRIELMNIVLNEGGNGAPSRGPELKRYILDQFSDNVSIYGKWSDEWLNSDNRFKGPVKFNDLFNKLLTTKYTLCIPISDGYVTAKFWEMIYCGIIPFMHPTYDTQMHIKCPDFLRIKSPDDLKNKINYLENNPEVYNKLRIHLSKMLTPGIMDGSELCKKIMTISCQLLNRSK